ncbi:hypothetical protein L596_016231 [Steinernema carpocapsae]|uniref:Uncharacterized protein n=1 Tax=Steinernema carpocapsae TaxID=34508 RepID=A0A4U5NHZ2_STECR|nr:hypothetical protein L596_016231 [Steinernema carpocapsae]
MSPSDQSEFAAPKESREGGEKKPKKMTAVRENFINLPPLEIPRPKCQGMQFINTRGRHGFYQSIRRNGAQYGLQIKPMGPRRAALPDQSFWMRPETVAEEEPGQQHEQQTTSIRSSPAANRDSGMSSDNESRRSSHSYFSSNDSSPNSGFRFSQPIMEEPEYPEPEPDYEDCTPIASVTPTSPPPPAPPLPNFQKNRMALAKKLSAGRL